MQRGVKLALVSGVLSTGVAGALLFQRDAPPDEGPPASGASVAASGAAGDTVDSAGGPPNAQPRSLLGRIELNDPPSAAPTGASLPVAPARAAPPAAAASQPAEAPSTAPPADLRVEPPPPLAPAYAPGGPATVASTWEGAVAAQVRLEAPAPIESELPPPAAGSIRLVRHKVRDGDTLSSLARRYLGRSERFVEIYDANRDRLPSPDLLPIGLELFIPVARETTEGGGLVAVPTGGLRRPADGHVSRSYRLRQSDTLRGIAERFYGDGDRWTEIYAANRERLSGPDDLPAGVELVLP